MTTIITKNSSTAGAVPTASDLVQGELAVNVTDKALYTENASGTVVKLNAPSIVDNGNATAITIDSSENVGIGTSSFDANWSPKLQVVSTASDGSGGILIESYRPSLIFKDDSASAVRQHIVADSSALLFGSGDASFTERMRIDSSGNLLMGTTTAQNARLVVETKSGGYILQGTNSNSVQIQVAANGNVQNSNNSYGAISDAKLKENVTDATPKLAQLNQVRVVNYNLIGDENKQLGVIAQELEQIFPAMIEETVDRDAEGNALGTTTKGVKYSVFVPMLIKAIQEQQAIITELTARIEALEAA